MQSVIGVLCADKTFIGGIAVRTEISYRSAYNAVEMQDGINKPIFIVGSPRSETSILSNESTVPMFPADFEIDLRGTDLSLVEQAMRLSQQLEQSLQPTKSCLAAIKEIEAGFDERAQFVAKLASRKP